MKKNIIFIFILTIIIIFSIIFMSNKGNDIYHDDKLGDTTNSIYSLSNSRMICGSIESQKLNVGIYSYYDDKEYILSLTNPTSCTNSSYFKNNLSNFAEGDDYTPWTFYSLADSSYKYYIDDTEVSKDYYQFLAISNRFATNSSSGKLKQNSTLKAGEKLFLDINLEDLDEMKINSDNMNDLRVSFNYGITSDINISLHNSVAYYIYDDNDIEYGPYRLGDAKKVGINYYGNDKPSTKVTEYTIVSEKLNNELPKNTKIKKIKIIPYEYYPFHSGAFRLYSLSVNNYENGYDYEKKYINVSNAESKIRHNIVDNMIANATLKWNYSSLNPTLKFYSAVTTGLPREYSPTSGKDYYGIPYVNRIDATIDSFLTQTTKNTNGYYTYNMTQVYLADAQSTKYKYEHSNNPSDYMNIKKGESIGDIIYVYESSEKDTTKEVRKRNLESYDFISNRPGYLYGMDCSSSVMYAEAREIPYLHSMTNTNYYFDSNQARMLGNLLYNHRDFEIELRKNNDDFNNKQITIDDVEERYSSYLKKIYDEQEFYNAYALLIPGDVVNKAGHIRMETGYPYVVCNDGISTHQYVEKFCSNHDGINPNESYIITTEISYSSFLNHVSREETGWNYNLDKKYTDIDSLDDLWKYKEEVNSNGKIVVNYNIDSKTRSFNVNAKYTFEELYGNNYSEIDEIGLEPGMYLPYRYTQLDKLKENKIERPNVEYILNNEFDIDEQNNLLYEFVRTNKMLKGTFFTNYLINGIKININNQDYYIYPNQTNEYSLYYDLNDSNILNALNNLNYDNYNEIKISFNMGPNIEEVRSTMNVDAEGYFEVLKITSPKKEDKIELTEKIVQYTGDNVLAEVSSLSGSKVNIKYYSNNICTNEIYNLPVNAGEYYIIATSNGNNEYQESILNCTKAITINKKNATLILEKESIILGTNEEIIMYTYDGDGTLSCNSTNDDIKCNIDTIKKQIKITKEGNIKGSIEIIGSDGTNYNSLNKVINIISEELKIKDISNVELKDGNLKIKIPYQYILIYKDLMNKIEIVSENINVYDALGSKVFDSEHIITTGSRIEISNQIYPIIISGDMNSDGKITALDYVAIRNHMLKNNVIKDNIIFIAGDMNSDGKITALDYVAIRKIMI